MAAGQHRPATNPLILRGSARDGHFARLRGHRARMVGRGTGRFMDLVQRAEIPTPVAVIASRHCPRRRWGWSRLLAPSLGSGIPPALGPPPPAPPANWASGPVPTILRRSGRGIWPHAWCRCPRAACACASIFPRRLLRRCLLPHRGKQIAEGDAEFGRLLLHFRPQRRPGIVELVPLLGLGGSDQRCKLLHRHAIEINGRGVGVFGHRQAPPSRPRLSYAIRLIGSATWRIPVVGGGR